MLNTVRWANIAAIIAVLVNLIILFVAIKDNHWDKGTKIGAVLTATVALAGLGVSFLSGRAQAEQLNRIEENTIQMLEVFSPTVDATDGLTVEEIDEYLAGKSDIFYRNEIFLVDVKVRLDDASEWGKSIEAQVGDTIELQMMYRNTTDALAENIMVRSVLPTNLEYVEDSTKLYNSNYQSSVLLKDNTVCTSGINIGDYSPEGNAYIRFKCVVKDNTLAEGMNQLVSWVSVTSNGKVLYDSADVFVEK